MTDKEIYREIKQSITSGDIATLPKEKLVQFQSALAQTPARLHFGAPQFQQIVDTVAIHLSAKLQNSGNNSPDNHWYKKPVGIIFLGVSVAVLVMCIKYLTNAP